MDELITTILQQAPTVAGLLLLALVLYRQNEKQQVQNDRLVERIINLTIEMRGCVETITQAIRQQEETD